MSPVLIGFLASLAAGVATVLGAVPIIFARHLTERLVDGMLGFAAGVMLSITAFGLMVPAIDLGGIGPTAGGFLLGAGVMYLLDMLLPHMHFIKGREGSALNLGRAWLLFLAMAIHNLPEGFSVGISFGSGDYGSAIALTIAIGVQNIPEGMAVALPLAQAGYSTGRAASYTLLTGIVQPAGALLGASLVVMVPSLLPWGFAFAGGAMFYVAFDELIPECYRRGHEREAGIGGILGFSLMMVLDTALG